MRMVITVQLTLLHTCQRIGIKLQPKNAMAGKELGSTFYLNKKSGLKMRGYIDSL